MKLIVKNDNKYDCLQTLPWILPLQNHLQSICKNNIIKYISQEEFPHDRNKPDNSIEILDQLIVFDAKSPANEDLSNFPKYVKNQTENLKANRANSVRTRRRNRQDREINRETQPKTRLHGRNPP